MRVLGIDYGTARVGLAVGDTETKFALPLTTLRGKKEEILLEVKAIVEKEGITRAVIGEPITLAGERGAMAQAVQVFAAELQRVIPSLSVAFIDERFSSRLADRLTDISGQERDAVAAAAILQMYFDAHDRV